MILERQRQRDGRSQWDPGRSVGVPQHSAKNIAEVQKRNSQSNTSCSCPQKPHRAIRFSLSSAFNILFHLFLSIHSNSTFGKFK